MLVIFPERLQIVEMFRLARFNEIKLVPGDRPVQFTQLNQPNAAAYDRHLEALGRRRITYDDGWFESTKCLYWKPRRLWSGIQYRQCSTHGR